MAGSSSDQSAAFWDGYIPRPINPRLQEALAMDRKREWEQLTEQQRRFRMAHCHNAPPPEVRNEPSDLRDAIGCRNPTCNRHGALVHHFVPQRVWATEEKARHTSRL